MFQRSTTHGSGPGGQPWHTPKLDAAGDIDGDGFDDVLVMRGSSFDVHFGSASGLTSLVTVSFPPPSVDVETLSAAGDVNGDGFADVVVGIPEADTAHVFLGSRNGVNSSPDWSVTGDVIGYGSQVSNAGDVNGDGYDDLLVSADGAGRVSLGLSCDVSKTDLFLGGPAGLSSAPTQTLSDGVVHSCFGYGIASAGDVNGDGFDDVLVSAYQSGWVDWPTMPGFGRVYLYLGSMSGLITPEEWSDRHPFGGEAAYFGWVLDGAGDINGDGFDDSIVRGLLGSDGFAQAVHYLFGYYGGTAPWSMRQTVHDYPATANTFTRWSTSEAGDVNGDGYDDVIYIMPDQGGSPDVVRVNLGSANGLVRPAAWRRLPPTGPTPNWQRRAAVSNAGDVDADGYDDILVADDQLRVYYGGENPTPIANAQTLSTPKNELLEVTLSGTDIYDDPLTFSVTTEPTNGTLDPSQIGAGIVFYTPQRGFSGQDVFTFSATDPYGKTGEADVTIDVTNQPPEFVAPTPEEDIEVVVNDSVIFQLAAQDRESDFITYGIDPLPQDAQFDDISGEFFWRPAFTQELTLTLTASDNADSTSRELVIDVIAEMEADAGTQADAGMPDAGDEGDAGTQADAGQTDAGNLPAVSDDGCGCSTTPLGSRLSSLALLLIALTSARVLRRRRRKILQF